MLRISAIVAIALTTCFASATVHAQLRWPVSVKFVYDANGTQPGSGNDPGCTVLNCSAISCEAEVYDKFDYANQVLGQHKRGYRLDVVEILHWTNPPEPDIRVCVGGADDGELCVNDGPADCSCSEPGLCNSQRP